MVTPANTAPGRSPVALEIEAEIPPRLPPLLAKVEKLMPTVRTEGRPLEAAA